MSIKNSNHFKVICIAALALPAVGDAPSDLRPGHKSILEFQDAF